MTTETAQQQKPQAAPPQEVEELEFELAEERQILAELEGKHYPEDKYVYERQGQYMLTYLGVKLACREFAARGEVIEVEGHAKWEYDPKDPEYVCVQVLARRVKIDPTTGTRILMDSQLGAKRKWIKEKLRSGEVRLDPSYWEKALGQAQRNAKQALLPQDFILEFIQLILKKGGAKNVRGAAAPARQQAKPQESKPPQQGKPKDAAPAQGAATQPAQGSAAPPAGAAPGAPAQDPAKRKLTLQQQFWAIFKNAIPQAKTEPQQRSTLKRFTGKTHVRELDEKVIATLGGAIRKVAEGESAVKELEDEKGVKTLTIYHAPTGAFHWPVGFKPKAAPPAQSTQQAAPPANTAPAGDPEAPPPADEAPLF